MKKWHKLAKEYIEKHDCILISEDYKNAKTAVKIKCSCGNIYSTTYDNFKASKNKACEDCTKKIIASERNKNFNKKARKYIEDKGCKLISESIFDAHAEIEIKCNCGRNYMVSYNKFQSCGQTMCRKCTNTKRWDLNKLIKYIESKECKLLKTAEYINLEQQVLLECQCGEIFHTTFRNFLYDKKHQCNKCSNIRRARANRLGIDKLKKKTREISKSILLTNTEYKDYKDIFTFECECGEKFRTTYHSFLSGKRACDKCVGGSKMEIIAQSFFDKEQIRYLPQYSFKELRGVNGGLLRFDFAIKDIFNNLIFLLELDGEQHFKPVNFSYKNAKEKFNTTVEHDERKNKYCRDNNIDLLRIPYYEAENIENILKEKIKNTNKQVNPVPIHC